MSIKKTFLLIFAVLSTNLALAQTESTEGSEETESTENSEGTEGTEGSESESATSILTFPNGFSPNGDDFNPTFKPKQYQNIEEFHAYIFNRWGQKLYEWDDVSADGWDGTYRGKPVKQGTYFVLVKARGSDGQEFNIRKDVNLLRGYTEETTNGNN